MITGNRTAKNLHKHMDQVNLVSQVDQVSLSQVNLVIQVDQVKLS